MHLLLSPARRDDRLRLERRGETLILNGEACDLSTVPEGGSLSPEDLGCAWLGGPVSRSGGRLRVPLILPHGPRAPRETLFPEPIEVTQDGPVALPPARAEEGGEGGA